MNNAGPRLSIVANALRVAAGGAFFAGLLAHAADVDIKRDFLPERPDKSQTPGTAKPREQDTTKFKEMFTPDPEANLIPMVPPPIQLRRPLTREEQEQFDRKKDWIFALPQANNQSPNEALGVRKDKLEGEEKPFKGVMLRYLEGESGAKSETANNSRTNGVAGGRGRDSRNAMDNRDPLETGDPLAPKDPFDKKTSRNAGGFQKEKDRSTADYSDPKRMAEREAAASKTSTVGVVGVPAALLRTPGDYSNGSSYLTDLNYSSLYGNANELREQHERNEERKSRAAEFRALLDHRPVPDKPPAGPGGANDPVNLFKDATVQPVNPVVGNRLEAFSGGNKSTLNFGNAGLPGGRPGGFNDFSPRPLGESSLSPSVFAPPPTVIQPPKPAVLEFPKRKL